MASFEIETISIPLASIRDGINQFHFDVTFRETPHGVNWSFPNGISLDAEVQTVDENYLVRTSVQGEAEMVCDRCAETFQKHINESVQTLFAFGVVDNASETGEDVRILDTSSDALVLTQEVIDSVQLGIPDKVLCRPECRGLCPFCGMNLNESACQCHEDSIDSRWEALKSIKFDDH